jgi:hypothetical protein
MWGRFLNVNWFMTERRAINLANVVLVQRGRNLDQSWSLKVFFVGEDDPILIHGYDADRLWAALAGVPAVPTEADRQDATDAFRRQRGDLGHTIEPTPLDVLGEPPAVLIGPTSMRESLV